jgi:hypothetical protein
MTSPKLAEFVVGRLAGAEQLSSDSLALTSITDVRAYQALAGLGLAMSADSRRLLLSAMTMAKGFRVTLEDATEPEGALIAGRSFTIERRKAPAEKL